MVSDIEIINNFNILTDGNLYLWGAGNTGLGVKEEIEESNFNKISYIIDSDQTKWGSKLGSIEVLDPGTLKEYIKVGDVLIIASVYEREIIAQIDKMKLIDIKLCTLYGLHMAIHLNLQSNKIKESYRRKHKYLYNIDKAKADVFHKSYERIGAVRNLLETRISEKTIFVFQPGKVGSSSIVKSLIKKGFIACTSHNIRYEKWDLGGLLREEYFAYLKYMKRNPIKIISLIREPIARDISLFWQLIRGKRLIYNDFLEKDFYLSFEKYLQFAYGDEKNLQEIPSYIKGRIKWGSQFDWYNTEMLSEFDLNIFEHEFRKEKGYTIIKKGNIELLLLKLEKLNKLEKIIGDFVGVTDFQLYNDNEAKEFDCHCAYKEFLENVKFKRSYFDFYYNENEYMKHFYSDSELKDFYKKWESHCN